MRGHGGRPDRGAPWSSIRSGCGTGGARRRSPWRASCGCPSRRGAGGQAIGGGRARSQVRPLSAAPGDEVLSASACWRTSPGQRGLRRRRPEPATTPSTACTASEGPVGRRRPATSDASAPLLAGERCRASITRRAGGGVLGGRPRRRPRDALRRPAAGGRQQPRGGRPRPPANGWRRRAEVRLARMPRSGPTGLRPHRPSRRWATSSARAARRPGRGAASPRSGRRHVLLCHWRHQPVGWPLAGPAVQNDAFLATGAPVLVEHQEPDFLLHVLGRPRDPSRCGRRGGPGPRRGGAPAGLPRRRSRSPWRPCGSAHPDVRTARVSWLSSTPASDGIRQGGRGTATATSR